MDRDSLLTPHRRTGGLERKDLPTLLLAAICVPFLIWGLRALIGWHIIPALEGRPPMGLDYYYYHAAALRFLRNPAALYQTNVNVIDSFLYPPPSILIFLPLTYLPLLVAYPLFVIVNYSFLILAVMLWIRLLEAETGRRLPWGVRAAWIIISLASAPTLMNATYGQINIIVLFLCILFLYATETGQPLVGGISLALAAWAKVFPGLLVVLFVLRPRFRKAALGFILGGAICPTVMLCLFPKSLASYIYYFTKLLPKMSSFTLSHFMNQSLSGALTRLRLDRAMLESQDWMNSYVMHPMSRSLSIATWMVLLGTVFFLFLGREKLCLMMIGGALLALMPMTAPLGWGHTYVLSIPLVLLALEHSSLLRGLWRWLPVILFLPLLIPSYTAIPVKVPWVLEELYYARYLLAIGAFACLGAYACFAVPDQDRGEMTAEGSGDGAAVRGRWGEGKASVL